MNYKKSVYITLMQKILAKRQLIIFGKYELIHHFLISNQWILAYTNYGSFIYYCIYLSNISIFTNLKIINIYIIENQTSILNTYQYFKMAIRMHYNKIFKKNIKIKINQY